MQTFGTCNLCFFEGKQYCRLVSKWEFSSCLRLSSICFKTFRRERSSFPFYGGRGVAFSVVFSQHYKLVCTTDVLVRSCFGPPRKEVRKSEAELGRMQASCHPLRLAFFILDINFLDVSALVHFEGWRSFLLWLFLQPWSTFLCRFCLFVPLLGQDADTSCLPALGRWTRCGLRTSLQTGTSSQKYSCIHLKHTHTHIQKEVTFKKKSKLGTDFFFLIW